jgi:hypothetical protein
MDAMGLNRRSDPALSIANKSYVHVFEPHAHLVGSADAAYDPERRAAGEFDSGGPGNAAEHLDPQVRQRRAAPVEQHDGDRRGRPTPTLSPSASTGQVVK